ncbi:MAG: hypothetical protein HY574_14380 [candidate division NC10 bacterium]|nr:hypothetical protein [candidate division NC10 bacterium]
MFRDLRKLAAVVPLALALATWPAGAGAEGPRVPFAEDADVAPMIPTAVGNSRPAIESDEAFVRGRVWANGIHPDWSFADAHIAAGPPPSEGEASRKPESVNLHLHPDHWVAASPSVMAPPEATATTGPGATASSGS